MSNLRRFFKDGDIVFVTLVTYSRMPIIVEHEDLLRQSILSVCVKTPFEIISYVYLPDHVHFIIDAKENDLISIIQRLKMSFGSYYRKRLNVKSGKTWQNRYWDHIIRSQSDMNNHIDYIHYNPVKHGLVKNPFDWGYSSIHDFKEKYTHDWGVKEKINIIGEFGE